MTQDAISAAESIPGARAFAKELAPSFIDHVCIASGFAPPSGSPLGEGVGAGFAWCELHCGSAVNAVLLAACNPDGDFHAFDTRSVLLDKGRLLTKDAQTRNVTFHEVGIAEALSATLPQFDYIVLNGIYSWVPVRERAILLTFVRKFLKPGGAVYVSYNARPGWNRLDPFRRVFREATRGQSMDIQGRFNAARDVYARLLAAKSPAVVASGVTPATIAEIERIPLELIAADYANDYAEPLYATEVFSDFAAIDCVFAGPASQTDAAAVLSGYEPFKSILPSMPQAVGRELVKDLLLDTRFRRDIFVRGGRRIAADNRAVVLNGLMFALERAGALIQYEAKLPYGQIQFDNPQARALVNLLDRGPRTFADLISEALERDIGADAVSASIHALLVTEQIRPIYRPSSSAEEGARKMRKAILERAAGPEAIGFLPSAYGTAFAVPVIDQIFSTLAADLSPAALAEKASHQVSLPESTIIDRARRYERNKTRYRSLGILN